MASTIIIYEGDGTTTDFTVPFDYLKKSFVTVRLGAGNTLTGGDYGDTGSDYYFLDKTTIRLKVAPASGEALTIRRHTSATERVVTFKDASILKATDLDTSQMQAFHIAEEGRDILEDSLSVNREGNWDAKGKRIINVGTPEADSDAMTYGVYKTDAKGAYQAKLDAERARDRAVEAETNSKKSEENAKLSEVTAQASAGTAVSASKYADAVKVENQAILQEAKEIRDESKVLDANTKDNANVAQVKANEAKVSETNAKKSEVNSKESEGNAKASEGKASASAELAKQWATKLGATVDGSEYSAKYYANKVNEVLTQVATDVVNRVTAEGTKQVGLVSNQGTTSVNAVKAQQTASVNAVVTQQDTSVKAVQTQQTTSVNAVTAEGTKQVGLVSTEGTKQVDLAKAQVTLATQSASTATAKATIATQQATLATTKASEAEDSATAANADATKAKDSATNAANSADTATTQATAASNSAKAAKLSEENAALSKTAAGTSETNAKASEVEAKKQADLAKGYATQGASGQINSDWAETNSTSKAFIKNKPTLGTLASKNSIAYTEVTGTPDLSVYALGSTLTAELAKKQTKGDYATNTALTEGLNKKENAGVCLPLTGGTLTGPLFLRNNNATGPEESGRWGLAAHKAGSDKEGLLLGTTDNIWFNYKVVERADGFSTTEFTGGFCNVQRYVTGLQIVTAAITIPFNKKVVTLTFTKPFINNTYSITTCKQTYPSNVDIAWDSPTTTGVSFYRRTPEGDYDFNTYITCAFIGRWL